MAEDMEQQVNAIFQPRTKVYCGTCTSYVPMQATQEGTLPAVCRHPHAVYRAETYEGMARISIPPDIRNQQQDCADWQPRTFWSDVGHNSLKRTMIYLAIFFLFMMVWYWRNMLP